MKKKQLFTLISPEEQHLTQNVKNLSVAASRSMLMDFPKTEGILSLNAARLNQKESRAKRPARAVKPLPESFYEIRSVDDLTQAGTGRALPAEMVEACLKKTDKVLLRMRQGRIKHPIQKIGYITDIRFCDVGITRPLVKLCRKLKAELVIFHVNLQGLPPVQNDFAEDIFRTTVFPPMAYPEVTFVHLDGDDAVIEMETAASVMEPDILAVSRTKCGLFERLFASPVTRETSYSLLPLLLYP